MSRKPIFVVSALALLLSGCGSGSHATSRPATASTPAARPPATGTLVAALSTPPGHNPAANKPWPITVTAHDPSGHPVHAHVRYQFLYSGAVVARRSNYAFTGTFHDIIQWPPEAVGLPLTFRAQISSRIGTKNLDYPVTVTR